MILTMSENYNCLYLLNHEAQKLIRTLFFTAACTGQVPVVTLLLHAGKGVMHLHCQLNLYTFIHFMC